MAVVLNKYREGLNPNNCNYRLTELYKRRDNIGESIDKYLSMDLGEEFLRNKEIEYRQVCDVIDELIEFRHQHKCALEGDAEYERS